MRTRFSLIALMALAPLCVYAADPATLEQVTADVEAKSADIHSFTTDYTTVVIMAGISINMGGAMQGKDKLMSTTMNMDMMGQQIGMKMVLDKTGTMWMDMDMMGQKQVMKMNLEQAAKMQEQMMPGMMPGLGGAGSTDNDPRQAMQQFTKTFDLSYGGKETLDGAEVYVLSGKMKEEFKQKLASAGGASATAMGMDLGAMMDSVRVKFGVSDGFPRSTEMLDATGTAWMMQTYKNVQVNPSLDDAVFTYTPPDGVQVMDLEEMMKQEEQEQQQQQQGAAQDGEFKNLEDALNDDTYEKKAEEIVKEENP